MIRCHLEGLSAQKQESLSRYLQQREATDLIECVQSEIASLEADACRQVLFHPETVWQGKPLSREAEISLGRATKLKVFLDVLAEISSPTYLFRKARLTIGS